MSQRTHTVHDCRNEINKLFEDMKRNNIKYSDVPHLWQHLEEIELALSSFRCTETMSLSDLNYCPL